MSAADPKHIARRPRVRTWRRTLRALARRGRARDALDDRAAGGADERAVGDERARADGRAGADGRAEPDARPGLTQLSPGPAGTDWRLDDGPLWPRRPLRPQQGRLGDCWVLASMLAIHETAPERLGDLLSAGADGTVEVRLPAVPAPILVDRRMPVDGAGRFVYGRREGANPGWVGVLEKAVAAHVAGGYGSLQRGFARFGLELLLGMPVRSSLRLPSARRIDAWRQEHRAIAASTHPLSGRVMTQHSPLPPNHVFAVVGADPHSGHVHLRNPTRPGQVLVLDARTFRRGFLSIDVSPPLR
ncbi:C2 family cysteine protease [Brachybacterium sp. 107]|uniref:C2 family cysteine protease n=1 Tax=Brachybacterium sp. 107 TaxID=3457736 RepID=UPI004034EF47